MTQIASDQLLPGQPYPLGVSKKNGGINFAIFGRNLLTITLCLYKAEDKEPLYEIPLSSLVNRTADIWHILIKDIPDTLLYAFRIENEQMVSNDTPESSQLIVDPYAREIHSHFPWIKHLAIEELKKSSYCPVGEIINEDHYDWEGDQSPRHAFEDLVLYEMHVRGFTQDPSSNVIEPGTFLGVIEKIPHLLDLGVNAIELLPIFEFDEGASHQINPVTNERVYNYWGYSSVNFFAPMKRFASQAGIGKASEEFKTMVKELHRHGIEVYLDVVFNHSTEGDERGPTYSFRGLAPSVYYMIDEKRKYSNYTGCGNTMNCNHPVVRNMIMDSLRYWATEMHVDGFRFDLASIFTRGRDGNPIEHSPIIESISEDPQLLHVKLIAEPWDAAGLYHVGSFPAEGTRWNEWNGKFRDTIRRFIKGTGNKGEFVTRICGSQDLYYNKLPNTSVNFVTAHDGFTLADLVAYNGKHNLINGEGDRDGSDNNDSWNCGYEGPTTNPAINKIRARQMRNLHLALMVSQGIPMLLMGDEYGHTKNGNNNTWCQDNELNWFLWNKLEENTGFHRFYKDMIKFRKQHAHFLYVRFLNDQDIEWHGKELFQPGWDRNNHFIAFVLNDPEEGKSNLYLAFNTREEEIEVNFPPDSETHEWKWIVNTFNESPLDFYEIPIVVTDKVYIMQRYSAVMLKSFPKT